MVRFIDKIDKHLNTYSIRTPLVCLANNSTVSAKNTHHLANRLKTRRPVSISVRRPYKCKFCPATFSTPSVLGYHLDMHKSPQFSCTVCGRTFYQNYSLTKHMKTHQQVRRFNCPFCQLSFLTGEGLRNHVGKHTGERSYKCGLCPSAFDCTAKSSAHRKRHLVLGEYQCEKCSYRVRKFALFKTHLMACSPALLIL